MNTQKLLLSIIALGLICLGIYLFVTAPPPLNINTDKTKKRYSVEESLTIVAKLNDAARTFYTKEIIGKGKVSGLKFHEDWRKNSIEAGPLPALFLRSTGSFIEKSPVPLGLYLGSDFPIVEANLFLGIQATKFREIKEDKKPKFFYDEDTERYIGMFPDYAGAQACVTCHNEHEDSPKTTWKLNDVMGATTWSYPNDSLSTDELIAMIDIYKKGINHTYDSYLKEISEFKTTTKPLIGMNWPSDGYFLPTNARWNDTISKLTSESLLKSILKEEI